MPKRFARYVTGALSHSPSPRARARRAVVFAAAIEPMEGRTMLSATASIVTVDWKGTSVQAYQGEYVLQTKNLKAFETLATTQKFVVTDLGGGGDYEVTTALSTSAVTALAKAHPAAVGTIAPNTVVTAADTFPNDVYAPLQYYLNNTGQEETYDYNGDGIVTAPDQGFSDPPYPDEEHVGTVGDDLDVKQAWDYTTGSSTVVVAVLDTGIDLTHPDLVGNIFSNPNVQADGSDIDGFTDDVNGWNFVSNDNDVSDDNGHGTNVSGIIGASGNNSIGVTGVDWNVKILPVKVLDASGTGSEAGIIQGVNYVTTLKDEGINIVAMNESLSGAGFPFDIASSNAVKAAGKAGIIDVVAAGNNSADNDRTLADPQQFEASIPTVISVAATDNQGNLAYFSNYGAATVDLAAPGINIYSTAPTYEVTLDDQPSEAGIPAFGLDYGYLSGTSQATPQVTGIIALEAAIKPDATPAQLKAALLDGVTPDSALDGANGTPNKVRTGGVANAYNAVKDILDQFDSVNTTRQGNWSGFYGAQGAYVVGDTSAFPSFADVTLDGTSTQILSTTTNSSIALQKVSDPSSRIEAFDASSSSESINIDFTDGASHLTRLYVADYDKQKRTELAQIIDTPTGAVLDSETLSNFKSGQYVSWNLQGDVTIKLTNESGPSAVFSGLFFDAPPTNANVFQGTDATTTGAAWSSKYGSAGEYIIGDTTAEDLPGYAQLSVSGQSTDVLKDVTNNTQGLQKADDYQHNIEAYWSAAGSFTIGLNLTDGEKHDVTLYTAAFVKKSRSERIEVIDVATGDVLYTEDLSSLGKGTYSTFDVSGDVQFVVSSTGGGNAVVSGLFLDGPPGAVVQFDGVDNTTAGNWRTAGYGSGEAYVAGQNFAGVDNLGDPTITASGVTEFVQSNTSTNPAALQSIYNSAANTRIEAYLYGADMTFNVNFNDELQHHVELYFADYDNAKRSETVQIYDSTTGALETTQRISNFSKGRYEIYDIRGPVKIVITNDSGPNAVLSGFFAD